MGNVKYPLSDDINQSINPWTWVFNTSGQQVGLFNLSVDLGHSANPEMEKAAVAAAGYGKQLGRIEEVLDILLRRLPEKTATALTQDDRDAIADYQSMRREIARAMKAAKG